MRAVSERGGGAARQSCYHRILLKKPQEPFVLSVTKWSRNTNGQAESKLLAPFDQAQDRLRLRAYALRSVRTGFSNELLGACV